MKNRFKIMTLSLFAMFVIASCENEPDTATISEELQEAVTLTEDVFSQSANDVDDAAISYESTSGRLGPEFGGMGFGFKECMTVEKTGDRENYPVQITISYEDDCTANEVTKSGAIVIDITGPGNEMGSQRIVTYDGYTVNGYVFSGIETHTFTGNGTFTVLLEDASILTPDGQTLSWTHEKERTQIEGEDTEDSEDDVYQTTGSSSGFFVGEEVSYSQAITTPLISRKDCFWIVEGVVESTVGDTTLSLDFGDGTCNDIAVRTEDGVSEEITLDFKMKSRKKRGA